MKMTLLTIVIHHALIIMDIVISVEVENVVKMVITLLDVQGLKEDPILHVLMQTIVII